MFFAEDFASFALSHGSSARLKAEQVAGLVPKQALNGFVGKGSFTKWCRKCFRMSARMYAEIDALAH